MGYGFWSSLFDAKLCFWAFFPDFFGGLLGYGVFWLWYVYLFFFWNYLMKFFIKLLNVLYAEN